MENKIKIHRRPEIEWTRIDEHIVIFDPNREDYFVVERTAANVWESLGVTTNLEEWEEDHSQREQLEVIAELFEYGLVLAQGEACDRLVRVLRAMKDAGLGPRVVLKSAANILGTFAGIAAATSTAVAADYNGGTGYLDGNFICGNNVICPTDNAQDYTDESEG